MAGEKITVSHQRFSQFVEAVTGLAKEGRMDVWDDALVVDDDRLKHAVALALGLIKPGSYGTELFDALARLTVGIALEAVCLRRNARSEIEVLMTQRALTETAGQGEWHCPGSVQRSGETHDDVFARLEQREFGAKIRFRQFVADVANLDPRGQFESKVHLCEVEEGGQGTWFPITGMPEKTNAIHRDRVIPTAVEAFRQQEREAQIRRTAGTLHRTLVESARGTGFFSTGERLEIISHVLRQIG